MPYQIWKRMSHSGLFPLFILLDFRYWDWPWPTRQDQTNDVTVTLFPNSRSNSSRQSRSSEKSGVRSGQHPVTTGLPVEPIHRLFCSIPSVVRYPLTVTAALWYWTVEDKVIYLVDLNKWKAMPVRPLDIFSCWNKMRSSRYNCIMVQAISLLTLLRMLTEGMTEVNTFPICYTPHLSWFQMNFHILSQWTMMTFLFFIWLQMIEIEPLLTIRVISIAWTILPVPFRFLFRYTKAGGVCLSIAIIQQVLF